MLIKVDIQQIKVPNTLKAISEIANKWRMKFDIPVIGITGSNGKTSTKELLSHVLSSKFKVHATEGNFNTKIGLPLTLLGMKKNHDISILEMGASVPGEIETLCLLAKPTHGIITNIAPAHLEGFGSIETIAYEKGALFRSLNKGISFVNKADKLVSKIQFSGKRITYGLSPDCDFPVDICHEDDGSLTLVIDSNVIPTSSHNLSFIKNCVAVSAISISLGVELQDLRSRIQTFSAPEGRCFVKQIKDITVIDDTYNANLTSSLAALDYLSAFSGSGRKIFVFGDMYELGPTSDKQHQKIGERCLELNLDGVFTIGEHTKHTNSIINNGMMSKHFMSRKDLIDSLQKIIESGDKVLFKGSRGMEMDKIIEGVFYT
ncbi:MAG: UDP-N-acetylmuramoyl-tripeptide--D-alanyl-D-alanine ligase [Candidatus Neomarinimicrobiota bacterium]|nr:MAG: UDP-N-acetylmuramoyl-tripeptide--D-alanyl-D-alanine ligase [Candidatus Neomarinimicrobiota bacterium]